MKDWHKIAVKVGLVLILIALTMPFVVGLPSAPEVTYVRNETKGLSDGTELNTSGGSITTMVLNATTQNVRWKAFVGNVTGSLTLDSADDYTIFDWSLTNVVGEVYATRNPDSIEWSNMACSTDLNITNEEKSINHTDNPNDNISSTFDEQKHDEFYVGNVRIVEDDCYSLHTYVNDTAQDTDFEEILLHDGKSMVYATILEEDADSYRTNETFDFQMIVPENGQPGWTSSTAYYFYVELI